MSTNGIATSKNISSIEINDVGLTEIPSINVGSITYLAIEGIPNIHQITVTIASIGTLQVNGNGFLDLSLHDTEGTAAIKTLDTLAYQAVAHSMPVLV